MSKKTTPNDVHRLNKNPEVVSEFLDWLDDTAVPSNDAENRRCERYRYRVELEVALKLPSGRVRYQATSRNLNRNGASFLLGQFVYPNTICQIQLVDLQKQRQTVAARIVRCRYVEGSGTLHEVGVCFLEPIDMAHFRRSKARRHFLLVDDDPNIHRLIGHWLRALDVGGTCVADGRRAAEMIEAAKFDAVLLGLEMPGMDGFETARELRQRGFGNPIVAVSALTDEKVRNQAEAAGCTSFLAKPIVVENLIEVIESLKGRPFFSALAEDPGMAELIGQFVKDLSEKVDELRDSFTRHDYEMLSRIARMLKGGGGTYGFKSIADAAAAVEQALGGKRDESRIRAQLDELVRVCLSARSKA